MCWLPPVVVHAAALGRRLDPCRPQPPPSRYPSVLQVRHVGGLFRLRPNSNLQFDSCALPYAALSATISDIVLEPASAISEHYSPPGSAAELQSKARSKTERGWQVSGARAHINSCVPTQARPHKPFGEFTTSPPIARKAYGFHARTLTLFHCLRWTRLRPRPSCPRRTWSHSVSASSLASSLRPL